MTVDGECFPLSTWERRTEETDGGYSPNVPTPTVCGNYNKAGSSASSGNGLATWVAMFPTPTASPYGSNKTDSPYAKRRLSLQAMAAKGTWPTPMARDWKGSGGNRNSPDLPMAVGGQLSPMWTEWLMGYPIGTTELKDWAMQWFRRVREKRSSV
jgi:hypothetical protein